LNYHHHHSRRRRRHHIYAGYLQLCTGNKPRFYGI